MRYVVWICILCCWSATGCQPSQSSSQTGPAGVVQRKASRRPPEIVARRRLVEVCEVYSAPAAPFVVAKAIRHANLAIFPICSATPRNADRFLTLDEGLKGALVEVFEVGASREGAVSPQAPPGGSEATGADEVAAGEAASSAGRPQATSAEETSLEQEAAEIIALEQGPSENDPFGNSTASVDGDVNRLLVLNRSDKPLYLMPGEIIVGGLQDRAIAEETIVPPGVEPAEVKVFCVEHGRWSRRDAAEYAMLAGALEALPGDVAELTAAAAIGKFVTSPGSLSKNARMSVQASGDQSEVWDQVSASNAKANVHSESGAFTQNYVQRDVTEKLQAYLDQLAAPVSGVQNVVGVAVAINGKMEVVDVFESTPLFRRLWPKLLKSYALDAANAQDDPEAAKVCTREAAQEFFEKAQGADVEKTESQGGLVVTARSADGVKSFSAGLQGMGGFGGAVHGAAY